MSSVILKPSNPNHSARSVIADILNPIPGGVRGLQKYHGQKVKDFNKELRHSLHEKEYQNKLKEAEKLIPKQEEFKMSKFKKVNSKVGIPKIQNEKPSTAPSVNLTKLNIEKHVTKEENKENISQKVESINNIQSMNLQVVEYNENDTGKDKGKNLIPKANEYNKVKRNSRDYISNNAKQIIKEGNVKKESLQEEKNFKNEQG